MSSDETDPAEEKRKLQKYWMRESVRRDEEDRKSPMTNATRTLNQCLETVRAAMDQPGDTPQRIIANELIRLGDLLIRKNSDYGCSAWSEPYMAPGVDARTAILVRMSDKVSRIHSLMKQNGTGLVDESLEDTIRDLQGYSTLWLACPKAAVKTL